MKTILNLNRMDTSNIGDLKTSPFDYFTPVGWRVLRRDILDSLIADRRSAWEADFDIADCIVIGGGGLLDIDYFQAGLHEVYRRRRADQKLIVWGAGHNHYNLANWSSIRHHVDLIPYNYTLIGLRDVSDAYDWAPCPSCMDSAFDEKFETKNDVILYKHVETEIGEYERNLLPHDIKIIDNYTPFEKVIRDLGESELILTSSFHGAYWGTLLKRKVIAFPFSSKFYGLKHAVPLCDVRDWGRFSKLAYSHPDALDECRTASRIFFEKFINLL
jgi:hypothetical protein